MMEEPTLSVISLFAGRLYCLPVWYVVGLMEVKMRKLQGKV